MVQDLGLFGRYEADFSHAMLFKRCANCPSTPPPCPTCQSDESCTLTMGDCSSCPSTMCTKIAASPTGTASSKSSSPAGPIAGGVIGGLALVCIMTYLVWRFCIRKRRQAYEEEVWRNTIAEKVDAGLHRRNRSSMHSMRSIASTVITRASNVIQIAYIPGVTNRSPDESSPDLIPPVPPIPAMSPPGTHSSSDHASTALGGGDEHFFLPSDLRNSTFSDYSADPHKSFARTSMSPSVNRCSVPSTAYRESAIVNTVPAQTAIRGKANAVAVKTNGAGRYSPSVVDSRSGTPNNAQRARQQPGSLGSHSNSPIVARLGVPKAVTVTKSNGSLSTTPTTSTTTRDNSASTASDRTAATALSPELGHNKTARVPSAVSALSATHPLQSSFDDRSITSDEDEYDEKAPQRSLMGHEKLQRSSRLNNTAPTSNSTVAAVASAPVSPVMTHPRRVSSIAAAAAGGLPHPAPLSPSTASQQGSPRTPYVPGTGTSSVYTTVPPTAVPTRNVSVVGGPSGAHSGAQTAGQSGSGSGSVQHKRSGSLNHIIEQATYIARQAPRHGGLGSISNIAEKQTRGGASAGANGASGGAAGVKEGHVTTMGDLRINLPTSDVTSRDMQRRSGGSPFGDEHAARTP